MIDRLFWPSLVLMVAALALASAASAAGVA